MAHQDSTSLEADLRSALTEAVGARPYRMWFTDTQLECDGDTIAVVAPTPLAARWIDQRFAAVIEDAARSVAGRDVRVEITVDQAAPPQEPDRAPAPQSTTRPKRPTTPLLGFDTFVVGTCNQLAAAAATRLAQDDGDGISPLFIHGACGVGKTHLLQAICREARGGGHRRVRYVTAERFTNEYIAASRSGEFQRFRRRYREVDLLAIDDVHFVASKERTQDELLHTLDTAGLRGARLALASDEDPRQIRRLNRALCNRLVAGMVVEVERPDRLTRTALVVQQAHRRGIDLTEAAVERLAGHAVGSVREVEGIVNALAAVSTLLGGPQDGPVGIDSVERLLRAAPVATSPIRMSVILEAVAARMGVAASEITGESRSAGVVLARSVAGWLGRRLTPLSFPELAMALGRRNHSTVHAAVGRIDQRLGEEGTVKVAGVEVPLREIVDQLSWEIRSRGADATSNRRRPGRTRATGRR